MNEELTPLLVPVSIKDHYGLVYWIYFIYGIAMLLPWNVFITASEYFAIRFAETPYKETFHNYFSTYFTIANLTTCVFVLFLQNKFTYKLSPFKSIVLNTIVFFILAVSAKTGNEGSGYFWFVMLLIVLTGGATSFFQNAVFSEASQLPPIYTQAVLCGQGLAGVLVSFSSIASMLIGSGQSTNRSACMYFISAFLMTVIALVGRILVIRLSFYRHHVQTKTTRVNVECTIQERKEEERPVQLLSVIKKISGLIFSVSYVFIITMILFPSITALVKSNQRADSSHRFFHDDIFVSFHFVLFNVGDWIGRFLPMFKCFQVSQVKSIVFLSTIRSLFIPVFLVCNVVVSEQRYLPVLIQSDMVYFGLLWLFAVTHGWICSLSMMKAPQLKTIQTANERSMVGSIMSFALISGLAIGGSSSFIARWIV